MPNASCSQPLRALPAALPPGKRYSQHEKHATPEGWSAARAGRTSAFRQTNRRPELPRLLAASVAALPPALRSLSARGGGVSLSGLPSAMIEMSSIQLRMSA
jgi:hypothetical protein